MVANMFSGIAPELQSAVLPRLMTYQFANVSSWVGRAAQVLDYVWWAPECAMHAALKIGRALPSQYTGLIRMGYP